MGSGEMEELIQHTNTLSVQPGGVSPPVNTNEEKTSAAAVQSDAASPLVKTFGEKTSAAATQSRGASPPAKTTEEVTSNADSLLDMDDPFRIGAPRLLPFPLIDLGSFEDAMHDVWPPVRLELLELLEVRSIKWHAMSVYKRHLRGTPEASAPPTIVIVASRSESNDNWKLFLRDAWDVISRFGRGLLHIELLAPIANGGKVEFPITSSEPVVERWPKLRSQTLSELGEEDWFCLQVVKKGYEESDSKVTVLV